MGGDGDGGYRLFRYGEAGAARRIDEPYCGEEFLPLCEVSGRVAAWAVRVRDGEAGPLFLRPTDDAGTVEIEERARRGKAIRKLPPVPADLPRPAVFTTKLRLRGCPRCRHGDLIWDPLASEYSCAACGWRG